MIKLIAGLFLPISVIMAISPVSMYLASAHGHTGALDLILSPFFIYAGLMIVSSLLFAVLVFANLRASLKNTIKSILKILFPILLLLTIADFILMVVGIYRSPALKFQVIPLSAIIVYLIILVYVNYYIFKEKPSGVTEAST